MTRWTLHWRPDDGGFVLAMAIRESHHGPLVRLQRWGWGWDSDLPLCPWPAYHAAPMPRSGVVDRCWSWFGFFYGVAETVKP